MKNALKKIGASFLAFAIAFGSVAAGDFRTAKADETQLEPKGTLTEEVTEKETAPSKDNTEEKKETEREKTVEKTEEAEIETEKETSEEKILPVAKKSNREWLKEKTPIIGGYYRTWHDVTSIGQTGESNGGQAVMSEIPETVNMVFVFDAWQAENSPYYEKLKTDYIPKMHEKGQKVIRTISVGELSGRHGMAKAEPDKYPNNEEGHKALAHDIVQKYVLDFGVDGLDIDIEPHDYMEDTSSKFFEKHRHTEEQGRMARGVLREIAKLIGPKSEGEHSDKFLIIDIAGLKADNKIFTENYDNVDLVLLQSYGSKGEAELNENWEGFKKYIAPSKFMVGFSFYEENSDYGNRWYDIPLVDGTVQISEHKFEPGDVTKSRAGRYAKWQPKGGLKAGVFAYAIERDGIKHPTRRQRPRQTPMDRKLPPTYEVSATLREILNGQSHQYAFTDRHDFVDEALLRELKSAGVERKGDVPLYDGDLLIDDADIVSLTGMNKFNNVRKVTLRNLPKLEVLDVAGMEKLELLELDDPAAFSKVRSVDISYNKLDLSEGTPERNMVDHFIEKIGKDQVKFDMQTPESYEDTNFVKLTETLEKADQPFVLTDIFTVTRSVRGTDMKTLMKAKVGDRAFLTPGYFYQPWDYSLYRLEVHNSEGVKVLDKREEVAGKTLDLSKDLTYKVEVYRLQKNWIGELTEYVKLAERFVKVGKGAEEFRVNLSLHPKVLWTTSFQRESWIKKVPYLFDGDTKENPLFKVFNLSFIIDIGEDARINRIKLFDSVEPAGQAAQVIIEAIRDKDFDPGKANDATVNKLKDLEKIYEFNRGDNRDTEISEDLKDPVTGARYFKVTMKQTGRYIQTGELQMIGIRKATPDVPKKPDQEKRTLPNFITGGGELRKTEETKKVEEEKKQEKKNSVEEVKTEESDKEGIAKRVLKRFTVKKAGYVVKKGDNVSVSAFTVKKSGKAVIGNIVKFEGLSYKITSLAQKAFKGIADLKHVVLGKHLVSIGKESFRGCMNLETLEIKALKVKYIGKNAFKGVNKNFTVIVSKKMTKKEVSKLKSMLKKAGVKAKVVTK